MGVSRRLPSDHLPRRLKLGETWVLLAHMMACGTRKNDKGAEFKVPGIFYAFRPTRFERLIWQRDAKPELLEDMVKDGITPIVIPDGDLEHSPDTPLIPDRRQLDAEESRILFADLREKLRKHE